MDYRQIQLNIKQSIDYHNLDHRDEWDLNCQGQYIALKTYSRISYRDDDQVEIQVKWSPLSQEDQYLIEIKLANYSLVFHPSQRTQTSYPTSQGQLDLDVETQSIEVNSSEIRIHYQIFAQGQSLGNYQYQLQYA